MQLVSNINYFDLTVNLVCSRSLRLQVYQNKRSLLLRIIILDALSFTSHVLAEISFYDTRIGTLCHCLLEQTYPFCKNFQSYFFSIVSCGHKRNPCLESLTQNLSHRAGILELNHFPSTSDI